MDKNNNLEVLDKKEDSNKPAEVEDLKVLHNHVRDFEKPAPVDLPKQPEDEWLNIEEHNHEGEPVSMKESEDHNEGITVEIGGDSLPKGLSDREKPKAFFASGVGKENEMRGNLTPEGLRLTKTLRELQNSYNKIQQMESGEDKNREMAEFDKRAGFNTGIEKTGQVNMKKVRAILLSQSEGPIHQGDKGEIHAYSHEAVDKEDDIIDAEEYFAGASEVPTNKPESVDDMPELSSQEGIDRINERGEQQKINRQLIMENEEKRWQNERNEKERKMKEEEAKFEAERHGLEVKKRRNTVLDAYERADYEEEMKNEAERGREIEEMKRKKEERIAEKRKNLFIREEADKEEEYKKLQEEGKIPNDFLIDRINRQDRKYAGKKAQAHEDVVAAEQDRKKLNEMEDMAVGTMSGEEVVELKEKISKPSPTADIREQENKAIKESINIIKEEKVKAEEAKEAEKVKAEEDAAWQNEQDKIISEDRARKKEEMAGVRAREKQRRDEARKKRADRKARNKELKEQYLAEHGGLHTIKYSQPVLSNKEYVKQHNRLDLMRAILPRIKDAGSEEERAEKIRRFNEIAGYDTGITEKWQEFSNKDLNNLFSEISKHQEIPGKHWDIKEENKNEDSGEENKDEQKVPSAEEKPKLKLYEEKDDLKAHVESLENEKLEPEYQSLIDKIAGGNTNRTGELSNIGVAEARALAERLPFSGLNLHNVKNISTDGLLVLLNAYQQGKGKMILFTGLETIDNNADLTNDFQTLERLSSFPEAVYWPDSIKKQIDEYRKMDVFEKEKKEMKKMA